MKLYIEMFKFHPPLLYPPTKYHRWKMKIYSNCFVVHETDQSFLHRVLAGNSYYGCTTERFDAIFVEADDTHSVAENKDGQSLSWFAKVLTFVLVSWNGNIRVQYCTHSKTFCSECDIIWSGKMAFVQWFEVLDEMAFPLDKIDSVLDCVRLRWQQTCSKAGLISFHA